MRLVTFENGGVRRVGVEVKDGGDFIDISAADPTIPKDMRSFLEAGESAISRAKAYVSFFDETESEE